MAVDVIHDVISLILPGIICQSYLVQELLPQSPIEILEFICQPLSHLDKADVLLHLQRRDFSIAIRELLGKPLFHLVLVALMLQLLFLHLLRMELHRDSVCSLLCLQFVEVLDDFLVGFGQVIEDPLRSELDSLNSVIHISYSVVQFGAQVL